jgi:hypothetical protein
MKAHQEGMVAMMEACLGKMEADQEELEANQERILVVSEHYEGVPHMKAMHVLTALQGQASDVLHEVEEAIGKTDDRFGPPVLPEDHIRREVGRTFAGGVADPDIKIRLLLGGKKIVSEGLRQELQAVLLAAIPQNTSVRTLWRS